VYSLQGYMSQTYTLSSTLLKAYIMGVRIKSVPLNSVPQLFTRCHCD